MFIIIQKQKFNLCHFFPAFLARPFINFLQSQRLSPRLQSIIAYVLSLVDSPLQSLGSDLPVLTAAAVSRLRSFLHSIGRYGNGAFLLTLYGMADIPQGFARLCAVYGGTFILR